MSTSLTDFTYYNNRSLGGIDPSELNSPQAQQNLAAVQQYDPSAYYRPTYGSDGQLIGYTLDYDASKLPGVSGTGSLGATSGHGSGADFMPSFSTVQPNMQLTNPNAVGKSPTYGTVTANENIKNPEDWISQWGGPALVAAFGAAFGGLPFLTQGFTGSLPSAGGDFMYTGEPGVDAWDPSVMGDPTAYGMNAPGTGILANQPIGSAESSLYGPDVLNSPSTALDSGLQPAAPITEAGTPARVGDVIRNGGIPGLSNIGQSLSEIGLGNIANALGKIPALGGTGAGTGTGTGGGLLGAGTYQMQPYKSLTALLRNYGLLGSQNG